MSYAVVQLGLEAPSVEQLRGAFRSVPGLTEIDALALGRDAFGILARGFEGEMAAALKDALVKEGVAAEVLEDAGLPQLPETFALSRVDCTPAALVIYDSLGREATLEWADVYIIAAGKVTVQEFVQVRKPWSQRISKTNYNIVNFFDGSLAYTDARIVGGKHRHLEVTPADVTTKEEPHDRHLLEIILAGGSLRYSINADKAMLLFGYLGGRRTKDLAQDFKLLVQDLARYAPQAALNRGSNSMQADAAGPFSYPNKTAFYHELVWLLWQSLRSQQPGRL